jgi:hypothetical protein
LTELILIERLVDRGQTIRQTPGALDLNAPGGLVLLFAEALAFSEEAPQMWTARELLDRAGALGNQFRIAQLEGAGIVHRARRDGRSGNREPRRHTARQIQRPTAVTAYGVTLVLPAGPVPIQTWPPGDTGSAAYDLNVERAVKEEHEQAGSFVGRLMAHALACWEVCVWTRSDQLTIRLERPIQHHNRVGGGVLVHTAFETSRIADKVMLLTRDGILKEQA